MNNKCQFVGTCINSFDDDGECIISELPFATISDFAYSEENHLNMNRLDFLNRVNVPEQLSSLLISERLLFLDLGNDIFALYDFDSDIHYFFCDGEIIMIPIESWCKD